VRGPALAAFVSALGIASAAAAQTPVPTPKPTPWVVHGPEATANTTTSGDQKEPSVAVGDDGAVVAWTSVGQDGDAGGIFARRFDAFGSPVAGEFQVNTTTAGDQSQPAAASDYAGNFVVVWTSPDGAGGTGVFGRRYDSSGSPLSGEFQVNTYTTGYQSSPRIAMNESGFVVVWSSAPLTAQTGQDGDLGGIFGQRYSVNGVPNGPEFRVNTYTTGEQRAPSVAMRPSSGDFTIVWESRGQDGDLGGIYGQSFLQSGGTDGPEFRVNDSTAGDQTSPDVAGADPASSAVVVVWSSEGQDESSTGVFGHVFSWILPVTSDFRVSQPSSQPQSHPRVGLDDFRRQFVVTWESFGQDDPTDPPSSGIVARRFDNSPYPTAVFFLASPLARGGEHQVNAYTTGDQSTPAVMVAPNGSFVVAWQSTGQDGDGEGVFAERFNFPAGVKMSVDAVASSGPSNVNGVLEAGEQVIVSPFWLNPVGLNPLPLYGSADNITGPEGTIATIIDSLADYGTLGPFQTNDCLTATSNCYEITLSGTRPAPHWDATFDEHPASAGPPGTQTKTWALHVGGSFPDVPQDAFYPYIENLFHNGVTAGGGCGPGLYCGEDLVLRQQMAVFLLKAKLGASYSPPPATGAVFADIPASDPFAPWIEELARRQVTGGCSAPPPPELPSYCPTAAVNRQQMAVFLVKGYFGFDPVGGFCSQQVFDDVPCSNPFAPYISYLWYYGIAAGCSASPPLYCPTDPTKRKQMAAFLVKNFGLQLYGPD
jgi:uncharacterized protein YfaP (DUF2135 family)